jgi:hypothetical protein
MPAAKNQIFRQDADGKDGAPQRRGVYFSRNRDAGALAMDLREHLRGKTEALVVPYAPANCLLFRARPADVEGVMKAAAALDRRPKKIIVESYAAGFALAKGENGTPKPAPQELNPKNFNGSLSETAAKLDALKKQGTIEYLSHSRLAILEDQPVAASARVHKPWVSGVTNAMQLKQSRITRTINYFAMDLATSLTASVSPDGLIRVKLDQKSSWVHVPEDARVLGTDEEGRPIRQSEFPAATFSGTLEIQAVAAKNVKTKLQPPRPFAKGAVVAPDSGLVQSLIIVGARLDAPKDLPQK